MRHKIVVMACAVVALAMPLSAARATETSTLVGVHPGKDGNFDKAQIGPLNAWQGKTNAILNVYTGLDAPAPPALFEDQVPAIWGSGSVPMITYYPLTPNSAVAAGAFDPQLLSWGVYAKQWLAGPNHIYGDADDRRFYLRYAWEMNGNWMEFSPCKTDNAVTATTAPEYVAAWRHVHDLWAGTLGIDRTHMAWIFSVHSEDVCEAGRMEVMYPGDDYVDWVGINVYDWVGTLTPSQILDPMTARLRTLAPTKPFGINEGGTSRTDPADKGRWLGQLFDWSHANDARMQVLFNIDKEAPWAFFGYVNGDETFHADCVDPPACTTNVDFKGYSGYRERVGDPWVKGSDLANPRLLTDAEFLGQDEQPPPVVPEGRPLLLLAALAILAAGAMTVRRRQRLSTRSSMRALVRPARGSSR